MRALGSFCRRRTGSRDVPGTLAATFAAAFTLALAFAPVTSAALGPSAPFVPPRALLEERSTAAAGGAASGSTTTGTASEAGPATPTTSTAPAASAPAATGEGIAGVRLGARPLALIDGQWWPLGGRPRGARLSAIDHHGAWLRHADGRQEYLALVAVPTVPSRSNPVRTGGNTAPTPP